MSGEVRSLSSIVKDHSNTPKSLTHGSFMIRVGSTHRFDKSRLSYFFTLLHFGPFLHQITDSLKV